MCKHCDIDLDSVLEQTAPPLDLVSISAFQTAIKKHAKKARRRADAFSCGYVIVPARQRRRSNLQTSSFLS